MTAPDPARIARTLLAQALSRRPELTHHDVRWSLSDEGGEHAIIWRLDPATDEWHEFASVHLTVEVKPRSLVVVGGVVYTGEEGA